MAAPFQNVVTGCYQDYAIPDVGALGIRLTGVNAWAAARYVIVPLFGIVTPGVTYLHQEDLPALLRSYALGGALDSGWLYYYAPTSRLSAVGDFASWFTSRSMPVPQENLPFSSLALPRTVPLPYGATGVRIYNFAYFGGFDAYAANLTFSFVDTSSVGAPLTPLGGGYAQSGLSVYRSAWLPPYGQSTSTPGSLSLSSIASAIALRGGLAAGDIDAASLSAVTTQGYPIARQSNAADCLLPLLQSYFGYASEYDAKLHFKFYGADAIVTVDRADLIEGNDSNNGAIVSNLRNQSTEFPRRVVGSYMDPAQNYTVVDTAAERRSVDVIAIGDQSFQIPVVMAAGDAAKAVDKALKVAYATLEGTLEYSVPFADANVYLSLAAGEPLQFQGKRYVLDEMMIGNGSLKLTTRYDRQSAYTSSVQPILGNAPVPPSSPYSGPTTLIPMNLPAQRPQDTVGVYLAAGSSTGSSAWLGCTVQASFDGMATWQNVAAIKTGSIFGSMVANEPFGGEPLTVDITSGDLSNATSAQLAAGANAWATCTPGTGRAQLGQFAAAAEYPATPNRYDLTGTVRSLGGVAQFPITSADRFTMMDAAYFLPIDPSFTGRTLYFRAIGLGESEADAVIETITYAALIKTPGDTRVTEAGDTRLAENGIDPRLTE